MRKYPPGQPPARSASVSNHLRDIPVPNASRQKGLAGSQAASPPAVRWASPLTILGVSFLSEVAYCAIAAMCYGCTARL